MRQCVDRNDDRGPARRPAGSRNWLPYSRLPDVNAPRSAVIVNPSKVIDLERKRRKEICDLPARRGRLARAALADHDHREDPGCKAWRSRRSRQASTWSSRAAATAPSWRSRRCPRRHRRRAGARPVRHRQPAGHQPRASPGMFGMPFVYRHRRRPAPHRRGHRSTGRTPAPGTPATFTVMAGMGFDAGDARRHPRHDLSARFGWPAYVAVSGLRHAAAQAGTDADPGPSRRRANGSAAWARTVLVANAGRLEGGIPLLPDAEPDDGWLDVAILSPRDITVTGCGSAG